MLEGVELDYLLGDIVDEFLVDWQFRVVPFVLDFF